MNRLDRLQAILIHLQSKKTVTAQELADRFETSIRTIYRDIRSLEEAGVPIGAEAGIGYFVTDNYHLPPVTFTDMEASALLFGSKLAEQLADKAVRSSFDSALFKIRSVLRSKEKEQFELLHQHVNVFNGGQFSDNLYLQDIQKALIENRKADIDYSAQNSDYPTSRRIVPLTLCFYGMRWHLIAYCELRGAYRDFRLDRLQSFSITDEIFDRAKYQTVEEYFESLKVQDESCKIVLAVDKTTASHIKEYKYWYGFTHEIETADGYEMHFFNSDFDGFARWAMYWSGKMQIISPPELNSLIVGRVKQLQQWYL